MSESIKDKVAIVGMGCTRFGERWDAGHEDLVIEAVSEALTDASVEIKDIQAGWIGTLGSFGFPGNTTSYAAGLSLSIPLKLQYVPCTRIENRCATGIDTLRNAAFAVAAKVYDLVLVVGVEKMKDMGYGGIGEPMVRPHPVYLQGFSPAGRYALAATSYFHKYSIAPESGKRLLATIAVKSHRNGARNPKAHLQKEITVEQAINAPLIAWPLGLFDCCGVTDGAAAAILCRAEDAKKYRSDYMLIKGMGIASGPGQGSIRTDYDFTIWDETVHASRQAFSDAGIKNPRKEVGLAEVHDCFTIAELIAMESLGLCERGHAREDIEGGQWEIGGEIPVNPSGGLKSFGHPVGASGCRETYEIYKQLQGKAQQSSRQIETPHIGLVHNQGGTPGMFVAGVAVYGLPV